MKRTGFDRLIDVAAFAGLALVGACLALGVFAVALAFVASIDFLWGQL